MIAFSLRCDKDHEYEAWFRDGAAYDEQAVAKKLVCPVCGSVKVVKAPMSPAIGRGTNALQADLKRTAEQARRVRQFVTGLRKYVEANAEYVGPRFPEEARKIHYGESEERHIYGEATIAEARELVEEGIQVVPLPDPVEEGN